jgi:hypothetical protein
MKNYAHQREKLYIQERMNEKWRFEKEMRKVSKQNRVENLVFTSDEIPF